MIALIKNEIIKLFSRKKTLVVFTLFCLLLGVIVFAEYKEEQRGIVHNSPEYQLESAENDLDYMEKQLKDSNISQAEKTMMQESIEETKSEIELIKEEINGKPMDWKEQLIEVNKDLKKQIEMQNDDPNIEARWIAQMEVNYEFNKYLIDNDIEPVESYELNANSHFSSTIMFLGAIFLAVGLAIFSADMVSGEFTPPTAKVLLTQPVKKGKVIFSKFIAVILSSIFLIIIAELLAYILTGIISGFGSLNYPVMVGYKYELVNSTTSATDKIFQLIKGSATVIPMWKYLINVTLLQILYIISAVAFVFMVSVIFKNSMISMGFSILTIIVVTIFQNFEFVRKFIPYTFSGLGYVGELYTGELAAMYENPLITPAFGITVFAGWTMVCYIIAHVVFVKRDAF